MKTKTTLASAVGMALGLVCSVSTSMAATVAGDVDPKLTVNLENMGWVQYGDARSYSLAIYDWWYENVVVGKNDSTYNPVPISAATNEVFAVTNEKAYGTNPGMEHPYETPSGNQSATFFATVPDTYQDINPTVNTVLDNSWDISVKALADYLTLADGTVYAPVFHFQNNQTGTNQFTNSLAAWARVWVTDPTGALVPDGSFVLTNSLSPFALVTEGGGGRFNGDVTTFSSTAVKPTAGGTPTATDYVLSGGDICVAYGTGANKMLPPVPVSCSTTASTLDPALKAAGYSEVSPPIEHNLGNESFAYAVVFPELNDLLLGLYNNPNSALYTLHVDLRLGCGSAGYTSDLGKMTVGDPCFSNVAGDIYSAWGNGLDNGPESVVIGGLRTSGPPVVIPEPGVIALLGLGLAGMGFISRRRRTA